ncbi:Ribosomal protein S18 acetylase RimI [Ectothiorhodospira mobilis]|uniref:Ribosomal protein S18 acetylase RimI n=1 Tax=Ectothiorhodospira mobilis TaxID=195064 RepID=A0A1I4SNH5_ECTMO|nr:GNAT family N-acetyltransferase [Ectothiorhodospira mobilis]SFM65941.1 Ribosomal protein S18 acetylase RimI [Ectothiorhodospira mobilis]
MTRTPFEIHIATQDHLSEIAYLARRIWHQCYPGIISREQIEYMLARMYSEPTLARDLAQGVTYYRLLHGERPAGFAACGPDACGHGQAWLHKLYVLAEHQGRGAGRALIERACADAAAAGHRLMLLRVNRENTRAIRAYQRCGFSLRETRCDDIGGGFVMDDYILQRRL